MYRILTPMVLALLPVALLYLGHRCSAESSIVDGPNSISAFETSFVPFSCLAYIDVGFEGKILWLQDSEVVADGNEVIDGLPLDNFAVMSTFRDQNLQSELNITDVTREHDGRYVCQVRVYKASNPDLIVASPSAVCTLKVFYLPIPMCPDQASFLLNEKVSILCFSDPGERPASLEWLMNGDVVVAYLISALDTTHSLYYTFVTSAADQNKIFECRTTSESFPGIVKTCVFGPIDITLNMSLERISTTGDDILVECTANGNGDIEYTFFQDEVLAVSAGTGNIFQVDLNENDTIITCHAVDSDDISGSVNITLPGRPTENSEVSSMTSEPQELPTPSTKAMTTLIIPPPMSVVYDNVYDNDVPVSVAVGSSCAAIVLIVCAIIFGFLLRRKCKQIPKPQVNDDLFLEEAFGRKRSVNVSFRKIQKRQSKQNSKEAAIDEEEDDGNAVQFISERELESSGDIGVRPMPDVITSAHQSNLAYSGSICEEEHRSVSDHDPIDEEHHFETGERNPEPLYLEAHSDLQSQNTVLTKAKEIRNMDDSATEGLEHEVHSEVPIVPSSVSSRLDSLIGESHSAQESDRHRILSTNSPSRDYPQTEVKRPTLPNTRAIYSSKQNDLHAVVSKKNADQEKPVKMTANNDRTHFIKENSFHGQTHRPTENYRPTSHPVLEKNLSGPDTVTVISSRSNGDSFDGANIEEPPREILPFIDTNSQLFSSSMETYKRHASHDYSKRVNSMPIKAVHTPRPIDIRPHVKPIRVNEMAGKGVVNPSQRPKRTSEIHDLNWRVPHHGEQNVVWNKGAKTKADPRLQNPPTVIRNKHTNARSYREETQPIRPQNPRAMDRKKPTGSQSLRDNNHHDAVSHQKGLPGRSARSTSHVGLVRNPGAKKNR